MRKKTSILFARTGVRKNSTLAAGSIHIKIHYSDYSERFINIINEVYDFSIKYRFIVVCFLQSHLLLCWHDFCDVSIRLYNVSVTLSSHALSKQILYVHPWSESTEFRGLGRGSSDWCLSLIVPLSLVKREYK